MKKQIVIVSPALADANNGNWQTARRWQQLLSRHYKVRIVREWLPGGEASADACMLALHARRSAPAIAAWAQARGATASAPAMVVVLTGTDLYRDIDSDDAARHSLQLARRLVVLQERGPESLPPALRERATVIFQSSTARRTLAKTRRHLRAVMVGHLREEKSPQTLFAAARRLDARDNILLDHIGEPLDTALGEQARATAQKCPHYRWLGGLPHESTRRRIQRAHLFIHTSKIEGGAHVVMEAVRSGTPVLASRIPGNVGMLGDDYAGYFDWNDAAQLATLLRRCRDGLARGALVHDPLYGRLQAQCAQRAPLFAPDAERAGLLQLIASVL
ncbi:MAG: selenoneine biosynthesis selenosugar synthase SenB [Betaproteobacteria bacterium]